MGGLSCGAGGGVGAVVLSQAECARSGAVEMGADWDSDSECFGGVCDGSACDGEESGENGEGGDGGEWAAAGAVGLFEHGVDFRRGVQCDEAERRAMESVRVFSPHDVHFLWIWRLDLLCTRLGQGTQ